MPLINIQVTFDDLVNYVSSLHEGHKISFNDFLKLNSPHKDEDSIFIQADLSDITFDENHKIDLTNADLSHTIVDGIEFDGRHVIIRKASLAGCDLSNTFFTNHIDLTGTNLGAVTLKSENFKQCNLLNAIYDPTQPKVAMVKVNNKQLEQYLDLRKKGVEVAQGTLNDYISHISRHYYPEDITIIADLSLEFDESIIIDEKFNGADLSGSNLEGCTFRGEIKNLTLRDCYFNQTLFENCTLIDSDLRGTSLTTVNNLSRSFVSIITEGKTSFVNPKLSVSGDENNGITKAISLGIISQDFQKSDFTITNPVLDPNYTKGSTKKEAERVKQYRKFSVEDVTQYASHCKELLNKAEEIPDFKSYMIVIHNISEEDRAFVSDLSNLDLSNLDLSNTNFEGSNFAYSKFRATNLENARLDNCNLSGTDFSSTRNFWFWRNTTSLQNASLVNSDLTTATLNDVDASGAILNKVIAVNIEAEGLNLTKAQANESNFAGSWLANVNATKLEANRTNLTYVFSRYSEYRKAKLNNSNLSYSDFTGSNFTKAEMNYTSLIATRLREANLTKAQFKASRVQADISHALLQETILEDADIAGLFNEPDQEPTLIKTDFSRAIESDASHFYTKMQTEQRIARKTKSIYNKYSIGIIIGAIALPLIAIALMSAILPTALAVTAISTTIAVAAPVVSVFALAIIIDRTVHSKLHFDLGITTTLANMLGAKRIINNVIAPLEKEVQAEQQWLEDYEKAQNRQLEEVETEIIFSSMKHQEQNISSGHSLQTSTPQHENSDRSAASEHNKHKEQNTIQDIVQSSNIPPMSSLQISTPKPQPQTPNRSESSKADKHLNKGADQSHASKLQDKEKQNTSFTTRQL